MGASALCVYVSAEMGERSAVQQPAYDGLCNYAQKITSCFGLDGKASGKCRERANESLTLTSTRVYVCVCLSCLVFECIPCCLGAVPKSLQWDRC